MNAFGMPREPARQPPLSGAPPVDPWTAAQQNPMLEAGLQYGQQVLQDKSQGLMSYITVVTGFRRYFRVDNQYVKRKLLMLLFPFLYRMPKGEVGGISSSASSGGGDYEEKGYPTGFGADAPVTTPTSGWQQDADNTPLPTEDVYAFDLYLPLMGATTYIILSSFIYGLHHNSVSNEQLLGPAWSLLFWLQVEVIILKVGCYLLRIVPASTILDLVALCSYKYITVCLAALLKEVFQLEGETIYNCAVLIYAALTTGFFTAMMLQRAHQRDQRAQYKVKLFAYSAALLQVPMVTWLSVRPFRDWNRERTPTEARQWGTARMGEERSLAWNLKGRSAIAVLCPATRHRILQSHAMTACIHRPLMATLEDLISVTYVGGLSGPLRKPEPFICLITRLLQVTPSPTVVMAMLRQDVHKYLRVAALFVIRLIGNNAMMREALQVGWDDYRKIRVYGSNEDCCRNTAGSGDNAVEENEPLMAAPRFAIMCVDEITDRLFNTEHGGRGSTWLGISFSTLL